MKIIQTFWSGNSPNLLKESYGWYDSKYHIQSWALSCQLLRRLYPRVELYTDTIGYDLLIRKLQLPYTQVHVVLDDLNNYPKSVWALSKIRTYSLQNEPFIHIDGDVFLWKPFDSHLTNSKLIAQNKEMGTPYFNESWNRLEKSLHFIPEEIQLYRKKEPFVRDYNFGIFGGNDLEFIQKYTQKAFQFVDQNLAVLETIQDINFNLFFEQYLFYCMADHQKVHTYFPEEILADRYKGLTRFEDVPVQKSYLHLLADFKKSESSCKKMSRQLSVEFPEQYLKCLEVTQSEDYAIFKRQLLSSFHQEDSEYTVLFSEYYNAVPEFQKFQKTKSLLEQFSPLAEEQLNTVFFSEQTIQKEVNRINHQKLTRLFHFEQKIKHYLTSLGDFDLIDHSKAVHESSKQYVNFLTNTDSFYIQTTKSFEIFEAYEPLCFDTIGKEQQNEGDAKLVIPSTYQPYYEEIVLDDIGSAILEECKAEKMTVSTLLKKMEAYFDSEELRHNYKAYQKLMTNAVKNLVYQKALMLEAIKT